jgi:hexosaminidase
MKTTAATLIFFAILAAGCTTHQPEEVSIIPKPVEISYGRGNLELSGQVAVYSKSHQEELAGVAGYIKELLNATDLEPFIAPKTTRRGIILDLDPGMENPEKYRLSIGRRSITITGGSPQGVFYGVQSLRQLLPPEVEKPELAATITKVTLPRLEITDYPLFPYRGMHLDVGRHFFPVSFIKRYIDLMVLHKMNNFHWHLTEDQGWRVEIKAYPLLTEIGAWRDETVILDGSPPPFRYDGIRYGGYYTQEEMREVVEYAAARFVNVIPEIDMPGHSSAALASYPVLGCTGGPYRVETIWGIFHDVFCAGSDYTFEFLETVLTEVVDMFPSQLIHIGGDESPKTRWEKCPRCQARIKEEGLADEYELQSYFIRRIEEFLLTKGRNIIGWDEILEGGLAPNATVMSYRSMQGGIDAARMGHDAIMTPTSHTYFDFYQADPSTQPPAFGGRTTLEVVYSFNPIPDELTPEEARHILGAQGNVWTEHMKTESHVEYMAYPRAVALAEILWTPREKQSFPDFQERLARHFKRLDVLDVNYFPDLHAK